MLRSTLAIAKKELKEMTYNKAMWLVLILTTALLVIVPLVTFSRFLINQKGLAMSQGANLLNAYIAYYSLFAMLFIAWSLIPDVFFGEKARKTIETLLATPLEVKTIWLGKTIAVTAIAYPLSLLSALGFCVGWLYLAHNVGGAIWPSGLALGQLLFISPLIGLAVIGLSGLLNLLLVDPKLGNLAIFILNFAVFFGLNAKLISLQVSLSTMWNLLILALSLLAISVYFTRFLNKERIILTIT